MVLSEIFPSTKAIPAQNTAMAETMKPGPVEISRNPPKPKAMLTARPVLTDVRSANHPAAGAHTDWART